MTTLPRKHLFDLPEGVIYLDGNSLGPMPTHAAERVAAMMRDEWADMLITGWNRAGWYVQPRRVGDRIARLIGAVQRAAPEAIAMCAAGTMRAPWLGLNCAACHTTEITYQGRRLRIEGAPTLADFDGLVNGLEAALVATANDGARLRRLALDLGEVAASIGLAATDPRLALAGLLARAVVVLDANGTVVYEQLVDEITTEPDYDSALAAVIWSSAARSPAFMTSMKKQVCVPAMGILRLMTAKPCA